MQQKYFIDVSFILPFYTNQSHNACCFLQVVRYADLYAATFLNLIYYPFSYMFRAPAMLLPHESTVAHEQRFSMDAPMISRTRSVIAPVPVLGSAAAKAATSVELSRIVANVAIASQSVPPRTIDEASEVFTLIQFVFLQY